MRSATAACAARCLVRALRRGALARPKAVDASALHRRVVTTYPAAVGLGRCTTAMG